MIRYSLTKDRMNPGKGGYIAKVKQWEPTGIDDILDYMVAEGTGLTRPQALAYFEKLIQTFEHFILMRGNVNTPLCRIQPTISGVFRDKADQFDPKRHRLHLRMEPGIRLRDLISEIIVEKENRPEHVPSPELFIDSASETENTIATPQGIASLKGYDLKFDPNDLRQGIFFVPETGSANIRVNFYASIRSTEVHFLIPALSPGKYTLVLQTIMRRHKTVRGGALQHLITVV